ncbi:dehydrogenase [Desulfitobacterium hafniense]|uniref:Dehydrogenase n=1 Tax=Desulfitobacterium hafniense TaxID=49338 RepID=A0A0W1JFY4_DESHA|nr:molecular chaperone TorD family protein [Desulfitobacterium hafniense]KTE90302.1 dehydrogenase [Desulfitobacterium hafniense]
MQNTTQREIEIALAISDMYQLLAMSLHLPTREFVKGLLDGSVAEDIQAILEEIGFGHEKAEQLAASLKSLPEQKKPLEEMLAELRQEYTRLFTHPKEPEISVYETLFRYNPEVDEVKPSLFISPAALDAERCYKKAGLILSKEVNEPADHIATEMEFMMFLYLQKAKALQEDNRQEVERREGEIKEFYEVHLQKWAKEFYDRCVESNHSEVYKALGEVGSMFVEAMLAD